MSDTSSVGADFGDAVMVLSKSPRLADLRLRDLDRVLIQPMSAGLVAVARQATEAGRHPLGVVIGARLSDADHARLTASDTEIDLTSLDWTGGENAWIVLAEAPKEAMAEVVKSSAGSIFAPGTKIHARLSDGDGSYKTVLLAD